AWVNRSKILEKLGRSAEATDSLAKAADLNPAKDEEYRLEVQNILRSTADASALPARWRQPAATAAPKAVDARLVEALSHYDSLLRADPSLIVAWRTKGEILDRLGRIDEARQSFERADRLEHAEGRSVVGIAAVVALMVIVPILASMLWPSPNGPSAIIRIDGDFSDWAKFPAYADSATDQVQNPDVNLLAVKVASQNQDLFVNARVQGLLFQSPGTNETGSVFVFLDEDNNRKTGYPIGD